MDIDQTLAALRALAHDSRLRAFRALVQAGPDGLPVGMLREALDLPPATLSAHLNVLRGAGLVRDAREGRVIRVRADYARMDALMGYLTENCCQGAACLPATSRRQSSCDSTDTVPANKAAAPAKRKSPSLRSAR